MTWTNEVFLILNIVSFTFIVFTGIWVAIRHIFKKKPVQTYLYRRPTFETFFNHEEITKLLAECGTVGMKTWDGQLVSLIADLEEMTDCLLKKGAQGYFWIVCSPKICNFLSTSIVSDALITGQIELGQRGVIFKGILNSKWRVYEDSQMPINKILIGCNDQFQDCRHYARHIAYNKDYNE